MRLRKRYVPLAAALGVAVALLPAVASSESGPAIEAVNTSIYTHAWSPAQTIVIAGSVVTIRNPTAVPHGVEWVGGPEKPTCSSGVPVGNTEAASGTEWSGTCSFASVGTYTFYCTVHGPEMTGTITVNANGTTTVSMPTMPTPTTPITPTTPVEPTPGAPPFSGLALRSAQHGDAVKGSLNIAKSGAGGRIEVDLFAKSSALGKSKHTKQLRVGHLQRGAVIAGKGSFVVALDAQARRALVHRHRLTLTAKLTLTPPSGAPLTLTRTIVAHA